MKVILLFTLFLAFISCAAAQTDTITIVSYNLLNFPDGRNDCGATNVNPSNRTDTLRKILGFLKPDILVACEIQTKAGADSVLSRSLNVFGATNFAMAPFQPSIGGGGSLNNALFYNTNKVTFLRQKSIQTDSRDINHFTLFANDPSLAAHRDTIFIEVHMSHLKAGSAAADQATRATQTQLFRDYVDARPLMRNHLFCGDLNVYRSTEAAYQNLIIGGILPFVDPISAPGNWNNNSSFAAIHTQSTRANGSFACGSTGGLDDRFDQILTTANIMNGANRLQYIANSYRAVGNDGLHFNQNINNGVNASYPDSVLNALYFMSDHLPVELKMIATWPTSNGLALTYTSNGPLCFGDSSGVATITPLLGNGAYTYLWDANAGNQTTATASGLLAGSYCVVVTDGNNLSDTLCFEIEGIPALSVGMFTTSATQGNCDGEAFLLVNGGIAPYNFLWNDPASQTAQSAINLCPGNYVCTVSDAGNCVRNVPVVIGGQLGLLDKLMANNALQVAPNPIENELSLFNSSSENLKVDALILFDMSGKSILHSTDLTISANSKFALSTDLLPKGMYFLTIHVLDAVGFIKVVK